MKSDEFSEYRSSLIVFIVAFVIALSSTLLAFGMLSNMKPRKAIQSARAEITSKDTPTNFLASAYVVGLKIEGHEGDSIKVSSKIYGSIKVGDKVCVSRYVNDKTKEPYEEWEIYKTDIIKTFSCK